MGKRKKKKDRIRILLCIVAVIFVLAGFAVGPGRIAVKNLNEVRIKVIQKIKAGENRRKLDDEKYVQAQMMEYLEERYHEKFIMKRYEDCLGTWYGNYIEMEVCPEGKDDGKHLFEVRGHPDDEWNLDYSDTRVDLRIKKEMEEYFRPYIDKYYENYFLYWIFLYSTSFSGNLPVDLTLEELFAQKYELNLHFSVNVEQQETDSNLENLKPLAKELQDNKFRGTLSVTFYVTDKNKSDDEAYCGYQVYDIYISKKEIVIEKKI